MLRRSHLVLLALLPVLAVLSDGRPGAWPLDAPSTVRLVVGVVNKPAGKLTPDLVLVKETGGVLVGHTPDGKAVIDTRGGTAAALFGLTTVKVTSVSTEAPKTIDKVERIAVSYAAGKKPARERLQRAGLKVLEDYEKGTFLIVATPSGVGAATVRALEADPAVTFVGPDYKVRVPPLPGAARGKAARAAGAGTRREPNDPLWKDLWGMRNINAPKAWDRVTESPVVVAVIDTGVDYGHEDLADNMWKNPDEVPGDGIDNDNNGIVDDVYGADIVNNDGDPMDDFGHGTHCAGTIGAVGNNGKGVVGVTWKVKVMAVKFLDANGSGSWIDAVKSIDYAISKKAQVMSNSWGGYGYSPELKEAIGRAEQAGILFVAAAGNEDNDNDTNPAYPASYDNANIVSVLAIEANEKKAAFSNYGKTTVDLGAPGVDIVSTVPASGPISDPSGYTRLSGTSMATPHVSGAAALVWGDSRYSGAPWQQVKQLLLQHSRPLDDLKDKCVTGGTLDIGFLGEGGDGGKCCPVVASAQFSWEEEKTATSNANILQVKIRLDQPMDVHIQANTSVTSKNGSLTFTNGFYNQETVQRMWAESLRFVSVSQANQWVNCGSSYAGRLPAGEHVIYWKVWMDGGDLLFDSGSLSVQAFPAASGGEAVARRRSAAAPALTEGRGRSAKSAARLVTGRDKSGHSVTEVDRGPGRGEVPRRAPRR